MKKYFASIFILTFSLTTLLAQKDETLIGKTGLKFSGLWGGSNIGLAGFDGENHGMFGGFFGLEFSKSLLLGFGGSSGSESTTYNGNYRKYDIDYGGFLIGYSYQSYKVVHPRVSFLIGSGTLKVKDEPEDNIFVVQPSAGIEVNLFRWFRMGLEGGYRFVSNTNLPKPNDGDASAPFAQLSLRFGWSWGKE
ncbi:MAG: hypothetical protein K9J37_18115 [Saprospiraceae bacterium]|nr:hypothetical protein [Saprospiraceae bacterium]MCF8251835.1 hypothetical protein [Saprospiraceae bacterium]MCF8281956.1 hypothetical protein [Bacteroidales bacterium]MCF8313309.1 hypothetical protein [Saprospiraceae bacterium]MCF8441735.1 hypothetical protein [Saprospiraceae bacterium]